MSSPIDIIKARIARSFLPEGYQIKKADIQEDRTQADSEALELKKAKALEGLDVIEERMSFLDEKISKGHGVYSDSAELTYLGKQYDILHSYFKSIDSEIEKGRRAMPIGTVSRGRKKIKEGVWQEINDPKKKS